MIMLKLVDHLGYNLSDNCRDESSGLQDEQEVPICLS